MDDIYSNEVGLSEREIKSLARKARKNKKPSQTQDTKKTNGHLAENENTAPIQAQLQEAQSGVDGNKSTVEEKITKAGKKKKRILNENVTGVDSETPNSQDPPLEKKRKHKTEKLNDIEASEELKEVVPAIENLESGAPEKKEDEPPKKKRKPRTDKSKDIKASEELKEVVPAIENLESVEPEKKEEEPLGTGFTVLEEFKANKQQKVFRVLPTWLAKPSIISCDLSKNKLPIKELNGLDKFLLEALRRNKIGHFFPVQQQVIPWLLESQQQLFRPCDICVSAPTGSGKTLAFVLPTIQALLRHSVRKLRCLAVLPVHDLAVQVYRVYSSFCADSHLQVALLSGQSTFYEEQQLLVRKSKAGQFLSKPDIVVCTPGRLVDHLQRTPGFSLKSLRYLIIDEADRIMEEEHNDWLFHVEKALNISPENLVAQKLSLPWTKYVQKLLFSATLSQDPEKLTRLGLFQPKLFTSVVSEDPLVNPTNSHHFVGKYTTPAELTEHFFECPPSLKPLAVYHLLKKFKYCRALCFTTSRAATHRLCELLKQLGDLKVAECSSEISKGARDQLLKEFSSGKIDLLVCTDAVSRGMDLGVVDCVISYDAPKFVKNYIHRAGRAARAGRPGTTITILMESEVKGFNKLLEMAEKKDVTPLDMQVEELEVYEEKFRAALDGLKHLVEEEKHTKVVESDKARRKKRFSQPKSGAIVSSKIFKRQARSTIKQPVKKSLSK